MNNVFRGAGAVIQHPATFEDIRLVASQELARLFGSEPVTPEAKAIIMQAREQAQRVIEEARREAESIHSRARQTGFDAGFREGRAAGIEQAADVAAREREILRRQVQKLADRIEEERRQLWLDSEPQVVAFVLEIAGKVIKDEAQVNRDIALSVIRNGLRRVANASSIRIRVNIDDLDTARGAREELASLLDGIRQIEIVEDRRVGVGGCVIETESGTIDARLDTQLQEIRRAVGAPMEEAA